MINAAIVGLGGWGQRLVRSVQGVSEQIRFTAAVARTPAKAAAFAAEQRLALHSDYERVLDDTAIDAIVLATPHSQHAEQVIAAANAGKAVFVEKPFTLTKESALAAVAACRKKNVILAFGHNRRFLPAMAALKQMIADRKLGTLLQIEGNFSSNSGYRQGPEAWRASRLESPAGGMTSLGIHVVDAMIHLCGKISEVETYSKHLALPIDIDDTTAILMKFAQGPLGYLGTVFASAPFWRLHVFGSNGWAEMHGQETLIVSARDGKVEELKFPPCDIERAELEALAHSVATGAVFPVPAEEAIHGVAVLQAIGQSAVSERAIVVG